MKELYEIRKTLFDCPIICVCHLCNGNMRAVKHDDSELMFLLCDECRCPSHSYYDINDCITDYYPTVKSKVIDFLNKIINKYIPERHWTYREGARRYVLPREQ